WKIDVEQVRLAKIEALSKLHHEVEIRDALQQLLAREDGGSVDLYKEAMTAIYECYRQKLLEVGLKGSIEDYSYRSFNTGQDYQFSGEGTTVEMLSQLRILYERQLMRRLAK